MRKSKRSLALLLAFAMSIASVTGSLATTAQAAVAPVGNGFTVTPADLAFILKQIKIAERHSRALQGTESTIPANPDPLGDPDYCQALLAPGADRIPDILTSYGLRTVDGACNNLKKGNFSPGVPNATLAAADEPFPRLTTPSFRDAEPITPSFPVGPPGPTSYKQKLAGNVVIDSQPRIISNLIVDQTSTNPAAIAAAEFPVRTQGNPGLHPCTTDPDPTADPPVDGVPAGCVPSHQTLFIPNVTTDVGLSPPYNSLFTFFGQFFDHGVDQTVKSSGTVFVPLRPDDPLRTVGPDGKPNTGDEVPASQAFMVLTRAQNQPGPDGVLGTADDIQNANNTDTPWVDQSQTYTSHASHQVFLREYQLVGGVPVSTGKLLGGDTPDTANGIGNWAQVKAQAASKLGLSLVDTDVLNVPMLATDPYGKFIPGPHGLPQYVTKGPDGIAGNADDTLVEGDLASPVPVPTNVIYFDTPFLTDIAHNADPSKQDTNHDGVPDTFPTPDTDTVANHNFLAQPAGTYDDELLNDHFICGDGRCNENIALTSIHQVFHSEHDRLVDYIKNVLTTDTSANGVTALAQWKLAAGADGWNGERLFQAARFVTEMEYQHLVFEEFARKVQPAVRPFHVYSPDIDPAVEAEFAHAVYRFGHSMLDDDVARTDTIENPGVKTTNDLPLLDAFLNPPAYTDGTNLKTHTPYHYTSEEAAGAIIMGSSDQIGNELDEFVTETLRNNLLGLPLDLPTLNMTRAREAGVPPLNDVRRQIHAQTNDGQLAPYTSWSDFGQHLKHPESLINFVAAYGTHPSITGATTLVDKRNAARAIVDPRAGTPAVGTTPAIPADVPPADASDFMFGVGAWADAGGKTTTGLDDVDLWVGGLAEVTNLNGGLLGSTFNYVFQTQLEKLQDGDRLYYLARTPGLNLRTQLEGNSFSELIERNTAGTTTLKADAFATADCKFELANLAGTPAGFTSFGSTVADDSTTPCDESKLLLRKPDGTIQYRSTNTVDPPGINGQAVYNGTVNNDRVTGGNDNDTFWGDDGNDIIEGNGGDDVALGGDGNDILTDLDGADVLKGGPGNDAADAGPGDDIMMGGDGSDFLNGGANDNEEFAGPGNDFVIAGQGADAVFGDSGDDWIEGGTGQDLLQGDHGAPFFDDPAQTAPGNDIFIGQPGENDYDAEGGDDLMAQNAAIDRNAGAAGFDWAFHQYDTVGADDDMKINQQLVGLPIQLVVNRDRWQETEADSGSAFADVIRGDDMERVTGPGGFSGCDALDPTGVGRIANLNELVTTFPSPLQPVFDASINPFCPLVGDGGTATNPGSGNVWAEGNILLGGAQSDVIEGRGNNDIIDGDHALSVRISVRTDPADASTEIGTTDLMEHAATSGNFGVGSTPTMTLQQAVFSGIVDPSHLVAVREIPMGTTPDNALAGDCGVASPQNCDTALYTGQILDAANFQTSLDAAYTITKNPNGSVTVADNAFVAAADLFAKGDGIDTLWNIENLRFCTRLDANKNCDQFHDVPVASIGAGAPLAAVTTVAPTDTTINTTSTTTATLTNSGTAALSITGVTVTGANASEFVATSHCGTNLAATQSCTIDIAFTPTAVGTRTATLTVTDNATPGSQSANLTGVGKAVADTTAPTLTASVPATGATGVGIAADLTATFSETVQGVSTATFTVRQGANAVLPSTVTAGPGTNQFTLNPTANLAANTVYTVTLTGNAATGIRDSANNPLVNTTWTFTTGAAADTTAPTAGAQSPVNNATNVAVAANATATFNEAVTGVSGTTATLRVGTATTGALVGSAVTYNATTRVVTINPNANLTADTRYTVRLSNGIKDVAGNALAPVSWTFLTGPAPTITARAPAVGANAIAVGSNVTATFSEAITGSSTTTATVRAGTAAPVAAVVTFNATTRVLTINPNANLATDTLYTVTLTGGAAAIRDAAGNPLATTTWTFRTGPAPSVTARTPASAAVGASRTANITATFSENVSGASAANVSLRTGTLTTGALIAGVVSYNATTHVVTINPNATLPANTQFTVRLTTGIKDIAGNPLPATQWSFTTGP